MSNNPSNYVQPGDIQINSIELLDFSKKKRLNIQDQLVDLVFYEDIFQETLYGSLTLNDAIGIFEGVDDAEIGFPIVGEEFLKLSFQVLNRQAISLEFFVYNVRNYGDAKNKKAKVYTLDFCSSENLADASTLVQRAYNKKINEIVEDIFKNDLSSSKKINFDITKGPQHYIVPNISPLSSIEHLRQLAVSEKYMSSSFVFFENKEGFFFTTLEKLIEDGKEKLEKAPDEYTFTYLPSLYQNDDGKYDFRNITNIITKKRFDTIEKLKFGYYGSNTLKYDFITKKIEHFSFDFKNSFESNLKHLAKNKLNTSSFLDKYNKKGSRRFSFTEDSSKPSTFFEDKLPNNASYFAGFSQNIITIFVPGDTSINAGDVIKLDIKEFVGLPVPPKDHRFLAGNFLVGTIKHVISNQKYGMVIDLYKDSFESEPKS